jgi:hypothetical protein
MLSLQFSPVFMIYSHTTRQYVFLTSKGLRRSNRMSSPHVRRRTLLAFRALSRHDPELLKRITNKVQKRLKDTDLAVVSSALIVSTDLVNVSGLRKQTALVVIALSTDDTRNQSDCQ